MHNTIRRGLLVCASAAFLALGHVTSVTSSFANELECPPSRSPYDVSFACAQAMSRAATDALLEANARERGEAIHSTSEPATLGIVDPRCQP